MINPKVLEERKRSIEQRLDGVMVGGSKPMLATSNIHYEMADPVDMPVDDRIEVADRNYDFAAWLSSTLLGAHEVQFHAYPVSLKPVVPEASGPWGRIGLIRRRRRSVGRKLAARNSGSSNKDSTPQGGPDARERFGDLQGDAMLGSPARVRTLRPRRPSPTAPSAAARGSRVPRRGAAQVGRWGPAKGPAAAGPVGVARTTGRSGAGFARSPAPDAPR